MATPRYITADEVCAIVPGMTRASLAQRRYRGLPPLFLKPSPRVVLYREQDVIDWVEASELSGTVDSDTVSR